MLSMQSRTKKSTLVLLGCLALAGLASCSGGGSSGSRDDDMKIYPPPENRAPEAVGSIPVQTVVEGDTETLDVEQYFTDPDGDRLTYSVASGDASVATATVSGSVVKIRGRTAGTATVRVTARDPRGLTAYQDVTVRVEAVQQNAPPIARGSIPDQTVVEGGTETLDVERYFTDPDGDRLTYSVASGDASVATATVSGSVVTIRGRTAGTATVRVTARDPGGLSAYQDFEVSVEAVEQNRAPEAVGSIPDQTVAVGSTKTLDVGRYFTDRNGDRLTYSVAPREDFVATATVSGSVVTISGHAADTTTTVRVTARDPGGLSAHQDFEVVVEYQGPEPVGSIPDQTIARGDTERLNIRSYFRDPDTDQLLHEAESSTL